METVKIIAIIMLGIPYYVAILSLILNIAAYFGRKK